MVGKPEGKRPLDDQDVGCCVILRWFWERSDVVIQTGFIWLRIGTIGGPFLTSELLI
jgi:hypothetical protein